MGNGLSFWFWGLHPRGEMKPLNRVMGISGSFLVSQKASNVSSSPVSSRFKAKIEQQRLEKPGISVQYQPDKDKALVG